MAANPPAEEVTDYLGRIIADTEFAARVQTVRNRLQRGAAAHATVETAELTAGCVDYELVTELLLLSLNGQDELPRQTVQVEYLRSEQLLIIPTALAMNPVTNGVGRVAPHNALVDRYWRATMLTFADIHGMIHDRMSPADILAYVLTVAPGATAELYADWKTPDWSGTTVEDTDMIMGVFSAALQFNCDIRDTGVLNLPYMSVADDAWKDVSTVVRDRLRNHLRPRTIQMLAALNYPQVASYDIASYVRAYGVGLGIMPSATSVTQIEWKCTIRQPEKAHLTLVRQCSERFSRSLLPVCANILAMFGLLHLAKDHTYRTTDADMQRIATSYVQTLRVMVTDQELDSLVSHLEQIVRTAPHPFGLAQTYWLARAMAVHNALCSPLAIRIDITPPPVQRLMIAHAARQEWRNLPAGRAIDRLFEDGYDQMEAEITLVRTNAPAYSNLHRLYGIAERTFISDEVMAFVQSMMPTVWGYAYVSHTENGEQRDGIAQALSLQNVLRDQKGLANLWQNAWAKYVNMLDEVGIVEFVESMRASIRGAAQP